jgi:hypothetical protein
MQGFKIEESPIGKKTGTDQDMMMHPTNSSLENEMQGLIGGGQQPKLINHASS